MKALGRWLALLLLGAIGLQLFFVLRLAAMAWIDPASTSFQRSEAFALWRSQGRIPWAQQWRPYGEISEHLKRAVVAAEDDGFVEHDGVEWGAIEKARARNARAAARADARHPPKLRGGSTISQQLAKNLFLSPARSYLRKAQEALITVMIEALWDKRRILEVYLNVVEWGDGVFGCEAAAQRYYHQSAARLDPTQAAHLAVMLPNPRKYEKTYGPRLAAHASRIQGRMQYSEVP